MYCIGATVSHAGASFLPGGERCAGLMCFHRLVLPIDLRNRWPSQNHKPNTKLNTSIE